MSVSAFADAVDGAAAPQAPGDSAESARRHMTLTRTFSQSSRAAEEHVKANVVQTAATRGMWGALYGGAASGLAMFVANKYNWMGIRKGIGISGKTGLIVTAMVAPFWLRGEQALIEGTKFPERFHDGAISAPPAIHGPRSLPLWQRLANHVYENPVSTWGGFNVPAYALIFTYESRNPATAGMHFSQRLLHTRVLGQFTAITSLLCIGMLGDTMKKAGGRFELPEDEKEEARKHLEAPRAQLVAPEGGVNWSMLLPLAYAPLLPLLRIGLRGRVTQRQLDLITGGTIALALGHAAVIMFTDSSMVG